MIKLKQMKKSIFILLSLICLIDAKVKAQSLTCLTPTLVFTDPTIAGNPTISPVIDCNYAGLIMIRSTPGLNGALTQGNTPCLRFATSLTNMNSATNNSMALQQGTQTPQFVCSACLVSVPSNSLFTL